MHNFIDFTIFFRPYEISVYNNWQIFTLAFLSILNMNSGLILYLCQN